MERFSYIRASSPNDAVNAAHTDSSFLAGGTTIVDLMRLGVMRPKRVIDINGLSGNYAFVEVGRENLRMGALTRMADAASHPEILRNYPIIARSLQLAASPQLRNMATLGGNVLQRTRCNYFRNIDWAQCNKRYPGSGCAALRGCNRKHAVLGTSEHCIATYPGDFAQALLALDAQVEIAGSGAPRRIHFEDLHVTPADKPDIETTLAPDEILLAFDVPVPAVPRSIFLKIRDRESYEFALASAAVALDLDGTTVQKARIALGGVATKPWRARDAEAILHGNTITPALAKAAADAAFSAAVTHGENDYKPELGRRTLVRALLQCAAMEV